MNAPFINNIKVKVSPINDHKITLEKPQIILPINIAIINEINTAPLFLQSNLYKTPAITP